MKPIAFFIQRRIFGKRARASIAVVLFLLGSFCHAYGENLQALSSGGISKNDALSTEQELILESITAGVEQGQYRDIPGRERMRKIADKLPVMDRERLFEQHKVSGFWGLLNFPLGIGSSVQGDFGTTVICDLGLVFGETGAFVGGTAYSSSGSKVGLAIQIGGLVILGASLIYGQVQPWLYANDQNTKLSFALDLDR